jgi:phosphate transport system substrate-binding protein
MLRAATDTEAADFVEQVPGAFAATTLAQIASERRNLVALRIDGRAPSVEALAAGRYPFYKSLFIIHRVDAHVDVGQFVDFVLSETGQGILAAHGHLPRNRFAS